MTVDEKPHPPTEQDKVLCWREEMFRELGFGDLMSERLADANTDLGVARKLIGDGCSRRLALRILL